MSSMRNTVQRRNHKERSQPNGREKWGVLEKHKDYSLRARAFQEKKQRLRILRQKAADRNPDEFHYGMLKSKQGAPSRPRQGLKLGDRGNPILSQDVVKLLKTQDAGYLKTMLQMTRRAREKMEEEFVLQEGKAIEASASLSQGDRQHIVFVDNQEEQAQFVPGNKYILSTRDNPLKQSEEEENDGDMTLNETLQAPKSRREVDREELALKKNSLLGRQRQKEQESRRSKIAALKARETDLITAENELELQRARMSNSVGGVTSTGVKWKVRERKK